MKPKLSFLDAARPASLCAALCAFLPAPSTAADCPTASLASVIALGACTIGDVTFGFADLHLPGQPLYLNGPFAGDTVAGPSAAAVIFTPSVLAGVVSFTLSGGFSVLGSPSSYVPSTGLYRQGNFADQELAYLDVTPGAGRALTSTGLDFAGAHVSGIRNDIALASFGGASVLVNGDGFSRLSATTDLGAGVAGLSLFALDFKEYSYSADPTQSSGFSAVSFHFVESGAPIAAVPEPSTYALLLGGLGGLGFVVRRRRA